MRRGLHSSAQRLLDAGITRRRTRASLVAYRAEAAQRRYQSPGEGSQTPPDSRHDDPGWDLNALGQGFVGGLRRFVFEVDRNRVDLQNQHVGQRGRLE